MCNRAKDWFKQAEKDLKHAEFSREHGEHEWACFAAQQTANKAVKAIQIQLGIKGEGYDIAELLGELPDSVQLPENMIEKGNVLDDYFYDTRYPNIFMDGPPCDNYSSDQSEQAIQYARDILEFIRSQMDK